MAFALIAAVVLTGMLLAIRGRGETQMVSVTEFLMDTYVTLRVPVRHEDTARAALSEMERLELIFDRYHGESEVSRVNAAAGAWADVGPEMLDLLAEVAGLTPHTGGLFDVTIGPLVDVWGFSSDAPRVPDPAELERARALVDDSRLLVDPARGRVMLEVPGMSLDLGGVAKGYIIDRAADVLVDAGVASAMVEVGGDIRLIGTRPGGDPWRIGVEHPRRARDVIGVLHLAGTAVATSGDYQRHFVEAGRRYHHIIDPATGLPAEGLMSVTVIAPTVAVADILSTAVFLMDVADGLALLESMAGVEGIIVDGDGDLFSTSGLAGGTAPRFETR